MKKLRLAFAFVFTLGIYPISFLSCFDWTRPAPLIYMGADETPDGREIHIGPCPRLWTFLICLPRDCDLIGGSRYAGNEWLFRFYRPFCRQWNDKNNYVSPDDAEKFQSS